MFCYPEHIPGQMRALFADLRAKRFLRDLAPAAFATGAAQFLGTLNATHAFRDRNGRTQLAFLAFLANRAGHLLALEQIDPDVFLFAMIRSFKGDDRHLSRQITKLIMERD